ncbi:hypothetical protein AB9N12_03160 [Bacteroides sp. AN502(2024)]|uniref:hypothetical protein n=1 Tax=Bacteroides sp. AN502(2024) TaxID=3160599 RepID=UPI003511A8F5
MKARKYILGIALIGLIGSGCTNTWDEHYAPNAGTVNNTEISIVNESLTDYLAQESSLSNMCQLFNETGMVEQLLAKEQMYTILAVESGVAAGDDPIYTAQTYISDASISPSNLKDGDRLLMWSGKYLKISKTDGENEASRSTTSRIQFNNATVTRVVKLTNGYLYLLDQAINAPKSMYEIIENLGDNYSIFREMILSRNVSVFDKEASKVVGVDNTGNTVYDSIFTVRAPYFEKVKFDIMSEDLSATMLIPSNDVINNTLKVAQDKLKEWNMVRADSILKNWIFQSAFFNKIYSKADFESNEDLTSVFNKQWRTSVQKVDLDHPISMSNGVAYYVTEMKIPTNVLIYRLKELFRNYEYLSADDKDTYFKTTNLSFNKISEKDEANCKGWAALGFPTVYYRVLYFNLTDLDNKTYTLDYTPFRGETVGNKYVAVPYKIPPGTYKLNMGFRQKKDLGAIAVSIIKGGVEIPVATLSQSKLNNASAYHYDRSGGGYPEGIDEAVAQGFKNKSKYDRDGGAVGTVTIPGDKASEITIRLSGSGSNLKEAALYHWCLRPTEDCY